LSMFALFEVMTLEGWGDNVRPLLHTRLHLVFFFLLFIFLSNLTLMNMLIGILCEVVTETSSEEKEFALRQDLADSVMTILESYDVEDDKSLRKAEFKPLMKNPDLQSILSSHNVDWVDLQKLEDVLFEEDEEEGDSPSSDSKRQPIAGKVFKEITFPEFLEKVFQLRGGNAASVTDMVELRTFLTKRFARLESKLLRNDSSITLRGLDTVVKPDPPPAAPDVAPPSVAELKEMTLPGQVGRQDSKDAANQHFQEAVMSQLAMLKANQDELRHEVAQLNRAIGELNTNQQQTGLPGIEC